jgi:ATP-dependent Lhr-like helicase
MLREDLPWLLPADRQADETALRSNAQLVWQTLRQRGALFWQELRTLTQLLPGHLDEALRELAALGLVTSDHFVPVRAIVGHGRTSRRMRRAGGVERAGQSTAAASPGRWCLFPGPVDDLPRTEVRERWCRLLLRRYGVVCRDLLVRETAAPPWPELVKVLRTLELRGEVRGGRFVAQLAGEQFASEEAVGELRRLQEEDPTEPWVVISAADPLNLVGLLTPESTRVPGVHAHTLILHRGQCLATRQAGRVEFRVAPPAEERAAMVRALATGRRPTEAKDNRCTQEV